MSLVTFYGFQLNSRPFRGTSQPFRPIRGPSAPFPRLRPFRGQDRLPRPSVAMGLILVPKGIPVLPFSFAFSLFLSPALRFSPSTKVFAFSFVFCLSAGIFKNSRKSLFFQKSHFFPVFLVFSLFFFSPWGKPLSAAKRRGR